MVAPTNFNLRTLRGTTFKGFVQFQDPGVGSTWFRLKERQTLNITFKFNRVQHYDDAGVLSLDPGGISHSFTMLLKVTADLFDNTFDTTSPISGIDTQTLTYWIAKNNVNEPIEVLFVTSMEMLTGPAGSTTEKFINLKFTLNPDTFGPITYGATGGSHEITVSGIVTSITEAIRDTTTDQ